MSIRTGSASLKASSEATADSLSAHWLSSCASNGPRWSWLGAPTSNSPHWSSLGALISNSPGLSSALDQLLTVLVATSAAPRLLARKYVCKPKTAKRHRGGVSQRGYARKERPVPHRMQRKRARFNMLARREPLCDGEGRGLRGLVEGSNECHDSNEDEGPEAHRAVHRLVRR